MNFSIKDVFVLSQEVKNALHLMQPVVALESTVITHGLPRPDNLRLARDMEQEVRSGGAVPATIGLVDGRVRVGMSSLDLDTLANAPNPLKVSHRDFATAIVKKASGGTTVAGTMFAAHKAGIVLFATGGIGGVHHEARFDVSTDLQALAQTPMIVVCAGAKSILDLPATLEYLETLGVPVVGYGTNTFPAFFTAKSDLPVSVRLDTPEEVADFARAHWGLGFRSAVLVTVPIPERESIPAKEADAWEEQASREAQQKKIRGQALTPFLLKRVSELSGGRSLSANLALLLNNASVAAKIARAWSVMQRQHRDI